MEEGTATSSSAREPTPLEKTIDNLVQQKVQQPMQKSETPIKQEEERVQIDLESESEKTDFVAMMKAMQVRHQEQMETTAAAAMAMQQA